TSAALRRPVTSTAAAVRVLDALGRPVRQAAFGAGQAELELSLSGLASGVYVVELAASGAQPTRSRLVVQ
ncbi:MAG: T9SS type A sorting domain-containing protein, partial [Hymenobacter sp.]